MLIALLLTAWFTLCGAALTYAWDRTSLIAVRLAAGVIIGMTVWGFVGFAFASGLAPHGMTPAAIVLSALPLAVGFVPLLSQANRQQLARDARRNRHALRLRFRDVGRWQMRIGFLVGLIILIPCLRGALYQRPDGWYTTNPFNHGDVAWHLAIVQGFAVGNNFPPQHPEYAGVRLTYPFLVDFTVAQYASLGMTVPGAFLLQNVVLALSLLVLGLRWVLQITRRPWAAAIAPAVWTLSGGWGAYLFYGDWRQSGLGLGAFLMNLPRDYTRDLAGGWSWGNMMTCLLITQRGLLMAFPLAFLVLTLLWQARGADKRRRLLWAGAVTGLLPLVHGHTFLSLLMIAMGQMVLSALGPVRVLLNRSANADVRREGKAQLLRLARDWVGFWVTAIVLALPQARLLAQGSEIDKGRFVGIQPGWDVGQENWVVFWVRNTGPLIPLLFAAWFWRRGKTRILDSRLRAYYLPFLLCFIIPNIVRLAPWVWDNIKVIIYWFLGSVAVVGRFLAYLVRRGRVQRVCAYILLIWLCMSGALDVWKVASGQKAQPVFTASDLAFAQLIRDKTPTGSLLIHSPRYNHPALLSGRHLGSGYEGHLWSHGLIYQERQDQIRRIYAGAPDADELIARLHVGYIVVGPAERTDDKLKVNEAYITHFPLVGEAGGYRLYATGQPPPP